MRVFVDLNVANKFYAFNLIGVPLGWSAFCMRGYEDRLNALQFEHDMAQRIARGNRLTFVVYGGGHLVKDWCKENDAVYVTPIITIKNKHKALERMAKNTAFFGQTVDLGKTLPKLTDMLAELVADFRTLKIAK